MRFLALMDLEGAVVTMDALHSRSDTAEQITDQYGVLTVKANQPSLYHALKRLPWKHVPRDSRPDHSRGRRVTRTVQAVVAPAWIDFPGARQVVKIRRTRTTRTRTVVTADAMHTQARTAGWGTSRVVVSLHATSRSCEVRLTRLFM
ncbi:DDE transposase family protein [Propionibacterium acidifaciens]|uniref:DDE transposase family protein n=2 Tax=Propionibacterium acidifaciens TaxID=556499 RepID=UPI00068641E7|nr:DDE transposase family protein [Propionibacterium acidifaciens]